MNKNNKINFLSIPIFIIAFFLGYSFIFWSLVPFLQMRTYTKNVTKDFDSLDDKFIFSPTTYIQPELRKYLGQFVYDNYPKDPKKIEYAIKKIIDTMSIQEHAKSYVLAGSLYSNLYKITKDQSILQKEEELYKKAFLLQPKSQKIAYLYTSNLIDQDRNEEAVDLMKKTIESENVYVPSSHEYYARALATLGEEKYNEVFSELEEVYKKSGNYLAVDSVAKIYIKLLGYYAKQQNFEKFNIVLEKLKEIDIKNLETYKKVEEFVIKNKKLPNIAFE